MRLWTVQFISRVILKIRRIAESQQIMLYTTSIGTNIFERDAGLDRVAS